MQKLPHTFILAAQYLRKEWLWPELCSGILMNWRKYPTVWESKHRAEEVNASEHGSIQLSWWFQETIPHIKLDSTLHKNWMIVRRAPLYYAHDCKRLPRRFRFIAHHIGNEWCWPQLCSAILMISRKSSTHWDS